jgi:urease accessory protein
MVSVAPLLLADGRFPAGGHAHSAGVEAAVADGRVHDLASLRAYVEGRMCTTALVDAAVAAATAEALVAGTDGPERGALGSLLGRLDAEADARLTPPPLRAASRRLGRQLLRVGNRCWPHPSLGVLSDRCPDGAHQPVALGAVGVAAGCGPADVAGLAAYQALTSPLQAAVRLLGLDPFGVAALTARLAPLAEEIAADAVSQAISAIERNDLAALPARSAPLVEIAALEHDAWDVRMFAT